MVEEHKGRIDAHGDNDCRVVFIVKLSSVSIRLVE